MAGLSCSAVMPMSSSSEAMGSGSGAAAGRPYSCTPCLAVRTAHDPALAAGATAARQSRASSSCFAPVREADGQDAVALRTGQVDG